MNLNELLDNNPAAGAAPNSDAVVLDDSVISVPDLALSEGAEAADEIAETLEKESSELGDTLTALEDLCSVLNKITETKGMCRALVTEAMHVYPSVDGGRSINNYSLNVSAVRYKPVVESLYEKIKDIVKKAIETLRKIFNGIIAMCKQWYSRLKDARLDSMLTDCTTLTKLCTQANGLFALHFAQADNQNKLPEWQNFASSASGELKNYPSLYITDPYVYGMLHNSDGLLDAADTKEFIAAGLKQVIETNTLFQGLLEQEETKVADKLLNFDGFGISIEIGKQNVDLKDYVTKTQKDYFDSVSKEMSFAAATKHNYDMAVLMSVMDRVINPRATYDLIRGFNNYYDEVIKLDETLVKVIRCVADKGFELNDVVANQLVSNVGAFGAEAVKFINVFRMALAMNFNTRKHTNAAMVNYFKGLAKLVEERTPETSKELLAKVEPIIKQLSTVSNNINNIFIK